MENNNIKLSVCIFTFNHALYIGQALESVLTQVTNFDFEIVIGEDCSTDGTIEIIEGYEKSYPDKIKVFYREQNVGLMRNNSETINRCRGEYIALLDGDDYWINNHKLQRQVDFLEANLDFSLCFHDGKILLPDGKWSAETCCGNEVKTITTFNDVICDVHIPTFSIVFRKRSLKHYPPAWFYQLNAPDRPLFLMLLNEGHGHYINECWAVYRKHSNGHWSSQNYQSQWLTSFKIYKMLNKAYDKRYNNKFCDCESKASFELAMLLLNDGKFIKAKCYLRKFRNSSLSSRSLVEMKTSFFYLTYLLLKIKTQISL